MFEISAKELAKIVGGIVEGDENTLVNSLCKIEEGAPNALSFLAHQKYLPYIYTTQASIIILNEDFLVDKASLKACLIRVKDARVTFSKLINFYASKLIPNKTGIESPVFTGEETDISKASYIGAFAYFGNHVTIGKNVKIFPGCYIGDHVLIGDNTVLYPGVKIYSGCKIGKDVIIQAGCVIGGDGFGFTPNQENNYEKITHIGNVIIEDYVEIGANTTIDKATVGSTIIRTGVKLDNLIQVAHNVEIGENTVIAAQTGIAGSTKIGKNCMIGGQVGIVGHLKIADNTKIAAQSGIGSTIDKTNAIYQGSPAFEISEYKRSYVLFKNLPSLKKEIDHLKQSLNSKI